MRRYDDRLDRIECLVGRREVTQQELARSAAWRELRTVLIAALEPYPEARQAVVERLLAHLGGDHGSGRRRGRR